MYQSHFGLSRAPFALTPDPRFFCALRSHVEAHHLTRMALGQGEGFVKITGEVGSGKTLLCRLLLNELRGKQAYAYIANPALSPLELKLQLARELGLPAVVGEALLNQAIERQLLALNKSGKPVVLIIDEAQALPPASLETLRLFSNLETETGKLLQIVLYGQPELDELLLQKNFRQLRQRIGFSCRLKPLSPRQTHAYLKHRLYRAGHQGRALFSPLAAWLVCRCAGGAPRLVNSIAHKALLLAFFRQRTRISLTGVLRAALDTDAARARLHALGRALMLTGAAIGASSAFALWSLA
jgi:MSHA biogenesis protein MshM